MSYLPSEQFNEAWAAIRAREAFTVSFADTVIHGDKFHDPTSFWACETLQPQGLAWRWIEAARNSGAELYIVTVNDIVFAFHTPFGWSFIPLKYYAWGRLPGKEFRGVHGAATDFLQTVLEVRDDDGSSSEV